MRLFNRTVGIEFPEKLTRSYDFKQALRYGENAHQKQRSIKAVYNASRLPQVQLHGKDIV
ncbi:hypothetical protein [Latilactobacillus curvatus]|uniref:hypothetical protein n=1 Tax=Latilactobacillus curvatus TaxID=28038 RepID=UPI0020A5BCB9|nr:hypothetical protein [Latilactobacillus curvatus]